MAEESLAELIATTDDDVVRRWLSGRGLVAVDRELMSSLAAVDNKTKMLGGFGITYSPATDRYYQR